MKSAGSVKDFLSKLGASAVPHGQRSLLEHLIGTCRLLEEHKERDAVCLAGLCHSIYGTNLFKHVTLESETGREMLRAEIGAEAENLVWLFSTWRGRPRSLLLDPGHDAALGPDVIRDLQVIELANLCEQGGWRAIAQYLPAPGSVS
jgi:hypothetical protein